MRLLGDQELTSISKPVRLVYMVLCSKVLSHFNILQPWKDLRTAL